MAFTCGFFNSQNGDRKYNAEQMASIFDGLIKDGVYDTVGDIFAVTPGTGMQVRVGSGRAWFDHTWSNNDAQYPLAITAADVSLPRYDAVVLETNHSDTVRTNRLRVLTGTPASNPAKPTMASSANVKQHPLAYIRVTAGATAITQSMIQVVVGTSECPFVTGIIETAQIDALFQQWNGEFDEWFDNLKAQLSDNVVANLQNQINQKVNKSDVATTADIEAGTSTTKWVSPKGLKDFSKDVGVYDPTTGVFKKIVSRPIFNIKESFSIPAKLFYGSKFYIVNDRLYVYGGYLVSGQYQSYVVIYDLNTGSKINQLSLGAGTVSSNTSIQLVASLAPEYVHAFYLNGNRYYRLDWNIARDGLVAAVTKNYTVTNVGSSTTYVNRSNTSFTLSPGSYSQYVVLGIDYAHDIIYIGGCNNQTMDFIRCNLASNSIVKLTSLSFVSFKPYDATIWYDDTYIYMANLNTFSDVSKNLGKVFKIKMSDGTNNLSDFTNAMYSVSSGSTDGLYSILGIINETVVGVSWPNTTYWLIDQTTGNITRTSIYSMLHNTSLYSHGSLVKPPRFNNFIYDNGRFIYPETMTMVDPRFTMTDGKDNFYSGISKQNGGFLLGGTPQYIDLYFDANNNYHPIINNDKRREITYIQ